MQQAPDQIAFAMFLDKTSGSIQSHLESMNFQLAGKQTAASYMQNGNVHLVVKSPENQLEQDFLDKHGPGVYMLGIQHPEPNAVLSRSGSQQASSPEHLCCGMPSISWVGDSRLCISQQPLQNLGKYFQAENINTNEYSGIDHCAYALPTEQLSTIKQQALDWLGYEVIYDLNIDTGSSGMRSCAVASNNRQSRLPLVAPHGDNSQVQDFINEFNGPGIQHLGLSCPTIITTVTELRKQGHEFLHMPAAYYNKVAIDELPITAAARQQLKEQEILLDITKEKNYLLQIFMKKSIGPFFFEIIERHQHDVFAENNIRALFSTLEEENKKIQQQKQTTN